jgi:putative selenate reductase
MGDRMRPVPFEELIDRIFSEYRNHGTIFGIHKEDFYKPSGKHSISVFGQKCSTPLGPAAGPHTQLAQNIVSAYMVGGRFMELKTVQIMDHLEIAKPCIDARDEGHNAEWSTEYTLEKAYDEYLKAWFAIHLIQAAFSGKVEDPDFIFNMSVGYNLDGIKQPKMQTFIDNMIDANRSPLFKEYKAALKNIIEDGNLLEGSDLEGHEKALKGLEERISASICPSVTISTMHGCPPKEIEAICTYMLTEKHRNTFVKLNPTLLGYDEVRRILDDIGFDHVGLKRESFEHDLQYPDAIAMLHRLVELAKKEKLGFGVKLTNTLGNVNDGKVLPGDERYMSGRALLPISTTVASRLSDEFGGKLPVSYSGGCTLFSVKDIFDTGIRPITMATDMLKPGGYARMARMAEKLEKESKTWAKTDIDPEAVRELSKNARTAEYSQREFRGEREAKVNDALPLFDCYVSPCMQACPIHQNIPDYVSLVGEGRYAEALSVIYEENALPNITCNICDHQCQFHCARMDYEGAVQIREMKKIAVEKGTNEYLQKLWEQPQAPADVKAAVVGAGPAGLSAAFFLARSGFDTTIYEKAPNAGGVVANIIPKFRIDPKAVQADIDHVAAHGVKFQYSAKKEDVTVKALKDAGYDFIYYAVGSEKDNLIKVEGEKDKVYGALEFLEAFKENKAASMLGKHVVVTGGGNTAMDSARAAKRTAGVEDVTVVYRRSRKEMPADPEEYKMVLDDGIKFYFLSNPKEIAGGKLICTKMALGEPDASGRRRPVETDETFILDCDALVTAIGEHADSEALTWYGLPVNGKGWPMVNPDTNETPVENVYAIGDVQSGPSTVVRCIASARKAVEASIDKVFDEIKDSEEVKDEPEVEEEYTEEPEDESYLEAEERFFKDVQERKTHLCTDCKSCSECKSVEEFARQEAKRCMDCTYYCNKCVDVCPNRANVAIDMRFSENTDDPFQILHLDAFCNECGNCATFCNHMGRPYKDKFTLFSRRDDFDDSTNSGFYVEGDQVLVRLEGKIIECHMDGEGELIGDVPALVKELIEQVFISYDYLLTRVEE